ncbi:hypothetical protein AALO_G00007500 [Alosa alosa]|uniref:Uncharacterized protein n=1 Tax=Alosa alosa TaxID=278164 RepID=A0AAV6HF00_9TELE|nr:hypothetical protein AALO_G00007500 [Alosa alosa]
MCFVCCPFGSPGQYKPKQQLRPFSLNNPSTILQRICRPDICIVWQKEDIVNSVHSLDVLVLCLHYFNRLQYYYLSVFHGPPSKKKNSRPTSTVYYTIGLLTEPPCLLSLHLAYGVRGFI